MRYVTLPLFGLLLVLLGGCQEAGPPPSAPRVPEESPKPSFVVQLSDADFLEKTRKGVVLLDAYAVWCGPCRMMEPHLEKAAEALQGKAMVARIDAEANREFARLHRIEGYPTLFVFVDGELMGKPFLGYHTEDQLLGLVEKYVTTTEPEPVVPASPENP